MTNACDRGTTSGHDDELSQKIPQVLVDLAHEPTLGLHFVCAHARERGIPQLVEMRGALRERTRIAEDMALDAQYTCESLSAGLEPTVKALREISGVVGRTREIIGDAAKEEVPIVSST